MGSKEDKKRLIGWYESPIEFSEVKIEKKTF